MSLKSKYMGSVLAAGLLTAGLLLAGCSESGKSGGNADETAGTPQNYPAPGINFFSDEIIDRAIDDSYFFGDRTAYLFDYRGSSVNRATADEICRDKVVDQNFAFWSRGYAKISGSSHWRRSGRRDGHLSARRGDRMAHVMRWKDRQGGGDLVSISGGLHLICFVSDRSNVSPVGMFFDAGRQSSLNVNMQFGNQGMRFSQPYYGNYKAGAGMGVVR